MNEQELLLKEEQLKARLDRLAEMEAKVAAQEKAAKEREKAKKQVLLRLSPSLWNDIASWAEDDFRSINAQIEYILTAAVKTRKKNTER